MSKYDLKVDPEDVKNFLNRIYGDPFQSYGLITTSLIDRIINDIKEKEMKISIVQTGEKTVKAYWFTNGETFESAEAKCAPEDNFDFQTGAKLAFERLMKKIEEKSKPTKLVGTMFGVFFGDIGELSPYRDKNGTRLYVGDVVYLPETKRFRSACTYVAKNSDGNFYIQGLKNYCYPKDGKLDSAIQDIVEKRKSYTDVSIGEVYCGVVAQ